MKKLVIHETRRTTYAVRQKEDFHYAVFSHLETAMISYAVQILRLGGMKATLEGEATKLS